MTTRALHCCQVFGCSALVRTPRCKAHTIERTDRQEKDPEQARFYSSSRWQKIRAIIRRRDPICKVCLRKPSQAVDHIDGDYANNDPDTNLRGICNDCHGAKSGVEHFRKRSDRVLPPLVVLVGLPGTGKSTIAKHLAPMLHAIPIGPDDFAGGWRELYPQLDASPCAVVECGIIPDFLLTRVAKRGAFIVELFTSDKVRRQRLVQRGEAPEVLERMMSQVRKLGYDRDVTAHMQIETSGNPKQLATMIATAFREAERKVGVGR